MAQKQTWEHRTKQTRTHAPSLSQTQKIGVSDRLGALGTREKLGSKSWISMGRTVLCVGDSKPTTHQIHFLLFWAGDQRNVSASPVVGSPFMTQSGKQNVSRSARPHARPKASHTQSSIPFPSCQLDADQHCKLARWQSHRVGENWVTESGQEYPFWILL